MELARIGATALDAVVANARVAWQGQARAVSHVDCRLVGLRGGDGGVSDQDPHDVGNGDVGRDSTRGFVVAVAAVGMEEPESRLLDRVARDGETTGIPGFGGKLGPR